MDTKSIAITALKASFYQEKLREISVMKLHETPNDLHNNKIRSLLLLAKFEKIGRLVENMRRIKSGLSRKMFHHF